MFLAGITQRATFAPRCVLAALCGGLWPTVASPAVDLGNGGKDLGPCVCNLLAGTCDAHCCCDPDCSSELAGDLAQSFDCLQAGPIDTSLQSCYSKDWIHRVSPRADLSVIADDLRGLLCVAVDNSEVKGVFHTNSPTESVGRIDAQRQQHGLSSFGEALAQAAGPSTRKRGYQAADAVQLHITRGSLELVTNMLLRTPGIFGSCGIDRGQQVRFLYNVPPTMCWHHIANLQEECSGAGALSPRGAAWGSQQEAWQVRKQQLPSTLKCGSDCLTPDVYLEGQAVQDPSLLEASYEGSSGSCLGALRSLHYLFFYTYDSGVLQLEKLEIHVETQSITALQATVPYNTSVAFLYGDGTAGEARSGNPGYLVGMPLLVAKCSEYSGQQCVKFEEPPSRPRTAMVPGVLVDGTCQETGSSSSARSIVANFGEDAVFGCVLPLSREELELKCTADGGFADTLPLLTQTLHIAGQDSRWTHLAAWGSVPAASQESEDWVKITVDAETEVPVFSDTVQTAASTSSCSNVLVGVDLEILYSPFGEIQNPQYKIVAARERHRLGLLTFREPSFRERQDFQFTFTVSFVQVDNEDVDVEVPARASLPAFLPQDLFYPFSLASSAWCGLGDLHLAVGFLFLVAMV